LSDVLGQLRGRSESTVVDAGPCQGAWAAAFSHLADVTLLVADHRDSAADVYAAVKKLACPAARSGRAKPPWLFFNRVVPPGRSESTQQAVIHTARRYLEIDPPPAGCLYEHEDPAGGLAVLVQTLAAAGIAAKTQKNDLCTQLVAAEGR
ncbi:MAG: hypothetical protein GTO03_01800, partial [Planctomycetales bacterium]|nr:hypothetical protein [Planctomycetales bacterium]